MFGLHLFNELITLSEQLETSPSPALSISSMLHGSNVIVQCNMRDPIWHWQRTEQPLSEDFVRMFLLPPLVFEAARLSAASWISHNGGGLPFVTADRPSSGVGITEDEVATSA